MVGEFGLAALGAILILARKDAVLLRASVTGAGFTFAFLRYCHGRSPGEEVESLGFEALLERSHAEVCRRRRAVADLFIQIPATVRT